MSGLIKFERQNPPLNCGYLLTIPNLYDKKITQKGDCQPFRYKLNWFLKIVTPIAGIFPNILNTCYKRSNKSKREMKVLKMITRSQIILTLFIGLGLVIFSCEEKEEPIVEEEIQETVRDIDGNEYNVVSIQGIKWLHQNLRTSKYRDGREIPEVQDNLAWSQLTTGAFSWYNNKNAANLGHGKLYNWEAATCCDICPEGFRVPTKEDFERVRLILGEYICEEIDCPPFLPWIIRESLYEGKRNPNGTFLIPKETRSGLWTIEKKNDEESIIYQLNNSFGSIDNISLTFRESTAPVKSGLPIKCVENR